MTREIMSESKFNWLVLEFLNQYEKVGVRAIEDVRNYAKGIREAFCIIDLDFEYK